jgi:hypothetical protein
MDRHQTSQTGYATIDSPIETSHSWPQEPLSLTLSWYAVGRMLGSWNRIPPKERKFLWVFHHTQSPCFSLWYPRALEVQLSASFPYRWNTWWVRAAGNANNLNSENCKEKLKHLVFHKQKFIPIISRTVYLPLSIFTVQLHAVEL